MKVNESCAARRTFLPAFARQDLPRRPHRATFRRWLAVCLIAFTVLPLRADEPTKPPPVLSDVVKLQIQNAALTVELWQVKLQQAQAELPKAQAAFQKLLTDHTPPGYQIDQALALVPVKVQ